MGKHPVPKRAVTPPKGRPTRRRADDRGERRVFGPLAQWILVTLLLAFLFVLLFVVTGGGDFNPFDDGTAALLPAATAWPIIG
ncbi:MAG: hypothetical protein ABIO83_03765 [Ilumatobacteraceae bacterium]